MEISDVKEKKRALENDIETLLTRFSEETELVVNSVNIESETLTDVEGNNRTDYVVSVKVEL